MDEQNIIVTDESSAQNKKKNKGRKKKKFLIIIAVIVAIMLFNSIKSATSPAGKVEKIIDKVKIVSLDETALLEAEEAYANLDETNKTQVGNAATLTQLREDYNNLKAAYDAIEAIGTVNSIEDATKVSTARAKFDKCTEEVKENVPNKDVLTSAEEKISDFKVQNVVKAINNIGKVTIDSKTKINEAQKLYDNLSDKEKAKVDNADTLKKASADFEEIMKTEGAERARKAFAGLRKEEDKVRGITWYRSKAEPYYADTRSFVLPYIGLQNGRAWVRLYYWYTADDWIFWKNVTVVVDGEKYYDSFGSFGTVRDNDNGYIWEYVDKEATQKDIEMLYAIADSKETIVRFEGDNYYDDIVISASDKKAIKEVLTAYEYAEYLK